MAKPAFRCRVCRQWFGVRPTSTVLPWHRDQLGNVCPGREQAPAERRGF